MGFLLFPIPAALLVGATSLAARRSSLLPAWLTRPGLLLAIVMVLCGVVGLLPQVRFALFGLWLAAVAITLMLRRVPDAT